MKLLLIYSIALLVGSVLAGGYIFTSFVDEAYSFDGLDYVAGFVSTISSEDDRILVFPASPELYFLSQRMPASKHLVHWEGEPIPEIDEADPPEAIVFLETTDKLTLSVSQHFDSYLEEHYCFLDALPVAPPLYKTYGYALIFKHQSQRGDCLFEF